MLAIFALCLATDPTLVDLHQEEADMDAAAKAEKQRFAEDAAWDPMATVTEDELKKEQKKLSAAHDLPVYSEINDEVRAETSFIQTKDAPDDGFAKVEAKLKALEEKMKSDAAKFEAEAKAPASSFIQTKDAPKDAPKAAPKKDEELAELEAKQAGFEKDTLKEIAKDAAKWADKAKGLGPVIADAPSSFVQTKDAPDDGFAKVEAKLKALEEKMKSDAAKFEAEAKAPASSFVQTSGQGKTLGKAKKWDSPLVEEASVFAGLQGDGASLVADSSSLPPMTPGSDDEELRTAPYSGSNPLSDPLPSTWTAHDELRSEEAQMSADLSSLEDTHKPAAIDPAGELAATFERPDGTVRPIESWLEEKELRRH